MSDNKLNQSLDDILKDRRSSGRGARRGRRAPGGKPTAAAAIGGVKKTTKPVKASGKPAIPTGPSGGSGESKIIVSNLPSDIDETQIKEYFSKTIGSIKKVVLTYGPNGQSRGICTITFGKPTAAAEAAKQLDGVKVDNRPMRVEVILSAKDAPAPPPAKTLSERMSQPKQAKAQPKPATAAKAAGRGGKGKRGTGRGRNAGRGKAKTAEELDAEMKDYFEAAPADGDAMVTNGGGAVQAPAGGDTGMEDEML